MVGVSRHVGSNPTLSVEFQTVCSNELMHKRTTYRNVPECPERVVSMGSPVLMTEHLTATPDPNAQQATGNSLEVVHERGDSRFGRVFQEQVHVVVFPVPLHQRGVRVGADVGEDGAQDVDSRGVEYTAAILCYEGQTRVSVGNTFCGVWCCLN